MGAQAVDFVQHVQDQRDRRQIEFEVPAEAQRHPRAAEHAAGKSPVVGALAHRLKHAFGDQRRQLFFARLTGLTQLDEGEFDFLFNDRRSKSYVLVVLCFYHFAE